MLFSDFTTASVSLPIVITLSFSAPVVLFFSSTLFRLKVTPTIRSSTLFELRVISMPLKLNLASWAFCSCFASEPVKLKLKSKPVLSAFSVAVALKPSFSSTSFAPFAAA